MECRRRVQHHLHGHRGRKNDPLYKTRRTLLTGGDLLADRQRNRLDNLLAVNARTEVEVTWSVYQAMVAAYRHTDRSQGGQMMARLIASLASGVPAALVEVAKLGRTLNKRAAESLRTSTGPTPPTAPQRP